MTGQISIRQIAKELSLSPSTVSLALNGRPGVSPKRREEVLAYCREVGYDMGRLRRSPGAGGSVAILTEVQSIPDPRAAAPRMHAIQTLIEGAGYDLVVGYVTADDIQQQRIPRMILNQKDLRGILIGSCRHVELVRMLAALDLPIVTTDFETLDLPVHCVGCDNLGGGLIATNYLLEKGHRNIGLISGLPDHPAHVARVLGYEQALKQAGVPVQRDLIIDDLPTAHDTEAAQGAAARILTQRGGDVDAFFCITDELSTGCLKAIKQSGRRVPDDVSLISFDDKPFIAHLDPPLTAVHWPSTEMGRAAIRRLLEVIHPDTEPDVKTPRKILLPARLVERESVAER